MKQMPLEKMSKAARDDLENDLVTTFNSLRATRIERRASAANFKETIDGLEDGLSAIMARLQEDLSAPTPEESEDDRKTAEEIAERMMGDEDS